MNWYKTTLEIPTHGKGLYDITGSVHAQLRDWNVHEGMCFVFLPHTSASLVLSENWDPTARADLATFMERTIPEGATWYTHDLEGADDATSHIRASRSSRSGGTPSGGSSSTATRSPAASRRCSTRSPGAAPSR